MSESILESITSMLGSDADYEVYQQDIILLINSALAHLNDLGAGPSEPLTIEDATTTWDDFSDNPYIRNMGKEIVFLDVKLGFDPPANSFTLSSYEKRLEEKSWRLERYCSEL